MRKNTRLTTRGKTVWIATPQGRFPTYGNTIVGCLAFRSADVGYAVTHIPSGLRVATAPNKRSAERVCRVLQSHFSSDNTLTKQGGQLYKRLAEEGAVVFFVEGYAVQISKAGVLS